MRVTKRQGELLERGASDIAFLSSVEDIVDDARNGTDKGDAASNAPTGTVVVQVTVVWPPPVAGQLQPIPLASPAVS